MKNSNARNPSSRVITTTISNIQWYKMLKNYLHISPLFKYPVFWNRYIPKSQRHTSVMSTNSANITSSSSFSKSYPTKTLSNEFPEKLLRSIILFVTGTLSMFTPIVIALRKFARTFPNLYHLWFL